MSDDGFGGWKPGGGPDGFGRDSAWTVDGRCPAPPGGRGRPWSATFTVVRGDGHGQPCQERRDDARDDSRARDDARARDEACGDAAGARHGVRAGEGGAFNPSVPLLATGGVLVAGAVGGAVYRLRRDAWGVFRK
ncbi:hypothetical protein [Streptomyces sp. NPDC005423]|uniref:hypothetical protein n=1 Tax=Streptomyces sp. NPDC005423 TaxID=3155343 RepID=UPI0033A3003F